MSLSDLMIEAFAAESATLRAAQAVGGVASAGGAPRRCRHGHRARRRSARGGDRPNAAGIDADRRRAADVAGRPAARPQGAAGRTRSRPRAAHRRRGRPREARAIRSVDNGRHATLRALRVLCRSLRASCCAACACTSGPGPVDDRPYIETVAGARAGQGSDAAHRQGLADSRGRAGDVPGPAVLRRSSPSSGVPAFLTEQRGGPPVIIEMQQTGRQDRADAQGRRRWASRWAPSSTR